MLKYVGREFYAAIVSTFLAKKERKKVIMMTIALIM